MARRSHELDSEAAQIPADSGKHISVGFARIASSGTHFPQLQRTAEQREPLLL
jgi:hypothetical protein